MLKKLMHFRRNSIVFTGKANSMKQPFTKKNNLKIFTIFKWFQISYLFNEATFKMYYSFSYLCITNRFKQKFSFNYNWNSSFPLEIFLASTSAALQPRCAPKHQRWLRQLFHQYHVPFRGLKLYLKVILIINYEVFLNNSFIECE